MSRSFSALLGRAFARRLDRNLGATARRNTGRRLRFESLEDRAVPAVYHVTDLGDNGGVDPNPGDNTGTLRQAIVDANATPDDDTIDFDPSLFGTPQAITLEAGLVAGADGGGLAIAGPGASLLTVRRDPAAGTDFRVLGSASPALDLSGFTISGGTAVAAGVLSQGTTTLDHMAITGNNANGIIGGLYVSGGQTVTITNSSISGNTSTQSGGLQVGNGATVNLIDSDVSGNTSTGAGGAGGILVFYNSTLNLERTTVTNNHAPAGAGGGIVALNGSTINIVDSALSGNTAKTAAGGIYIAAGCTLTVQNSTISGNQTTAGDGGAIFAGGYNATSTYLAAVTLVDSTVSGNTASGNAGGLYLGAYASLEVNASTISGNTSTGSGGGVNVRAYNAMVVHDSTISGNTAAKGAGIYFGYNGSLAMYGSTISGNHATVTADNLGGGALYFYGTASTVNPAFPNSLVIVNSTIANNTSASSGGAILLNTFNGGLVMGNTTVVGNSAANTKAGQGGGGIAVFGGTTAVQMANTIVSGNTSVNGPDILSGQTVYSLYSAFGSSSGFTDSGGGGNLAVGTNLKLGPLADNGGPTRTMAPQPGSPLIDAGSDTYGAQAGPTDQLGSAHVRIFGSHVDIGAYEVQPPTVDVEVAAGQADPTNGSISFDVRFNVPVTGLAAGSFAVTYGGGVDSSGATTALVPDPLDASHYTFTVGGLAGEGDVTVSLPAGSAVDGSQTGNVASTSTDATVHFDAVAPTETIVVASGQADPTNGNIRFDVQFDELVDSFNFSNVTFTSGPGLTIGGLTGSVTQDAGDPTLYHVTVAGGLTGDGLLTASIAAGALTDVAGNDNLASTGTASVRFDGVGPVATISQDAGQADPASGTSVRFAIAFTEPVAGFDGSQLDFTGSTATPIGANFTVQATQVDPTHYTVTVGGVATAGAIVVNLPAGTLGDLLGNLNGASTIVDNSVVLNPPGTLQFSQPTVSAAEQGGADVTFTVTRTGGTFGTLTVDYAVDPASTATLGSDYTFTPGTLTFANGAGTSQTFTVHVNDDRLFEGDETVVLKLANLTYDDGVNGAVALNENIGTPSTETLTITDVEEGTFQFDSATYNGTEGADLTVTVTRTSGTAGPASVDLTLSAGTADAGDIGTALGTATLNFADGEASKTVTIHVNTDGLSEGAETILLQLGNAQPGGAQVGAIGAATLTIAPSDPVALNAGNRFTQKFTDTDQDTVTVKLTGSKTGTVNVYLDNQTPASLQGPISLIELVGTDPDKSSLSVAVIKAKKAVNPNADGVTTIGGVTGRGLKALSAAKANLDGDLGPGVELTGYLGSLTLGNVLHGADITAGAGVRPTRVTLGAVGDGTDVDIANVLSTFTATSFGDGSIKAQAATSITIKGNARAVPANPGDFGADVTLDGVNVAVGKPTLGVLKVAGSLLATADVDVTGKVGTVTVGTAKKGNSFAGSLTADTVTSITVNGNLTGDITVTGRGVASGKPALGTLSVKGVNVKGVGVVGGTVDGATIHVGDGTNVGNVTSVTAVNFLNSEFFAGYAGAPDGSGTFNAAGAPAGTVGKFTVSDTFANSNAVADLFKKVSIKTVTTANPTTFGLFAHAFTSVRVTTPAITAPSDTPVGQFFVKVV